MILGQNSEDRSDATISFVFQDITNWKSGTEPITGLEIVFKDRNH
jgi:hypothetical protein